MAPRLTWRRITGGLLVVFGAGLLTLCVIAGVVVVYGTQDQAQDADAIVVLGGGASTGRRAIHAAALYHAGYAEVVICTGAAVPGDLTSEAERCARAARRQGVPAGAILLEENSRSTEENAIEVAAMVRARGWDRVVVVSDNYHLLRAHWMFAREGLTAFTSPAQVTVGRLAWREWFPSVWREVLALVWFVFKTVLGLPYTNMKGV